MRHLPRHLQQTISDHLAAGLSDLGWMESPGPFGTTPVRIQEVEPEVTTRTDANVVGVTIQDETDDREWELGGGVWVCDYDIEVDVFAKSVSIVIALASDVKDLLTDRVIPLHNYAVDPPGQTGSRIEFDSIRVGRRVAGEIGFESKRTWRLVDGIARAYFPRKSS